MTEGTDMGESLLHRALLANAGFSALAGLGLPIAAEPLEAMLGPGASESVLTGLGLALLAFAGVVWYFVRQPRLNLAVGTLVLLLDDLWVIGSLVLLVGFGHLFTPLGRIVIAVVAVVVAGFAIVEYIGLRRAARARQADDAAVDRGDLK